MEIDLIRHGMTAGNALKKYIGRTDEPLSGMGIASVKESGIFFDVRKVYVSPMLRAKMTASIKFPSAVQIVIDDLRELDFGDFEGRSADEMADNPAYREWVDGYCAGTCPGGEDRAHFARRVSLAFQRIVDDSLSSGDARAVVVTHGGVVMSIMEKYAIPQKSFYEWRTGACGGFRSRLQFTEQGAIILTGCKAI